MAGNQENEIDQALIFRMGQGDEEALRDFILRYQDRVYGTVAKMIGNTGPDVEDLAQQVFLRIWKAAPRHRAEAKISTWVMTVTRNLYVLYLTGESERGFGCGFGSGYGGSEGEERAHDGEESERRFIGKGTGACGTVGLRAPSYEAETSSPFKATRGVGVCRDW